jgi:hypothetical protein
MADLLLVPLISENFVKALSKALISDIVFVAVSAKGIDAHDFYRWLITSSHENLLLRFVMRMMKMHL